MRLELLEVMLNLQDKECPVTVQMNWLPLFRMVHFKLVDLFLSVNLAPMHMTVREENLIGVSPLCLGTLIKEDLTLGIQKLRMVGCLVWADLLTTTPGGGMIYWDET